MAILSNPAWPTPPRFTSCGFSPPHKSGGVGMGWAFSPVLRGGAEMSLDFLDPSRPSSY